MTCQDFRRLHLEFLDGTLERDTFALLSAHREECVSCARLHVALRRGLTVARSLTPLRPSRSFTRGLRSRLRLAAWEPSITTHAAREARIRLA